MTVIMLMVLCSVALVGCADVNLPAGGDNQENNKPVVPDPVEPDDSGEYIQSSLTEFFTLWFESKNKSFYMPHSGIRGILNDNIAMVTETMDHSYCNIYEYEGRNVNIYRGSGETSDKTLEWNYTKKVLDESTDAEYFDIVNYFNDLMKHSADWQEWWIFSDEFFEENFVQDEEGFYVGQEVLIGVKIGFTGTEMRLISPGYPEFEYTEVYTIGSDKIVIPEEAKDAMQTEINKAKSPAEFIQRWLDGGNKTFYIQDGNGVGTLYENMFMMTDGENTYSIYEYVDGKINHYTTTQNGWEAKVYTVEEMEEQMGVTFEGIQTL
ncbi:MAG: hypothetical protein K2P12_03775, partial [Clostridia bacterium]|nr:hypothetical protein [Clostridia bacterium]